MSFWKNIIPKVGKYACKTFFQHVSRRHMFWFGCIDFMLPPSDWAQFNWNFSEWKISGIYFFKYKYSNGKLSQKLLCVWRFSSKTSLFLKIPEYFLKLLICAWKPPYILHSLNNSRQSNNVCMFLVNKLFQVWPSLAKNKKNSFALIILLV